MLAAVRARLTYSNVMATLALFFALAGTASAAVIITSNSEVAPDTISGHSPPAGAHSNLIADSVNSVDLTDRGVLTADLAPDSVISGKIDDGSVTTGDLAANAVTSPKLGDGQVQNADLATDAVTSAKILNLQVGNVDLATSAVTSAKVLDGSLTGIDVQNRGLSDSDIGSPAQVVGADLPAIGPNSCIALNLNFGGWNQVGELVIASARDGGLGPSGLFLTPLVVTTAGTASGRYCNLTTSTLNPDPEDILAWSIRQ